MAKNQTLGRRLATAAATLGLAALVTACATQPAAPVAELAPTGRLRAAINFGNPILASKDPATGAPRGVSVDLAQELGRRLGVPVELVTFQGAGKVVDALKNAQVDIGFVAGALARHGIEGAAVAPLGR